MEKSLENVDCLKESYPSNHIFFFTHVMILRRLMWLRFTKSMHLSSVVTSSYDMIEVDVDDVPTDALWCK